MYTDWMNPNPNKRGSGVFWLLRLNAEKNNSFATISGQSLSNFQEQVEVIHWHKQHEMNDDGVDNALKDISSRVNGIRLKADRLKADGV